MRKISSFLILAVFSFQIALAQNIDALKKEIYSKLKCCKCELSFAECRCIDAVKMKTYIDALLESGLSKDEAFYKIAKKYTPDVIIDKSLKKAIENRLKKEAGSTRPEINLDRDSYNFGNVSKKSGKINKVFRIYNKGNSDLVVSNIRTSCGCISASLKAAGARSPYFGVSGASPGWQVIIAPGKSGELDIVLDLQDSSMGHGKQARDVFMATNDPLRPNILIRVEAEVGV